MTVKLADGPLTIMFTDIEGSTALRTTLGDDRANELFRDHDELIREQIDFHSGRMLNTTGDGFLAAFTSVRPPPHTTAIRALDELPETVGRLRKLLLDR